MLLYELGLHRADILEQDGLELCDGDGVVKVQVLLVPLVGSAPIPVPAEGLVDGVYVLHAALTRNEGLGEGKHVQVGETDSEWVPPLFDFWVGVLGELEVDVQLLEELERHVLLALDELQDEDHLLVRVVGLVIHVVNWGSLSTQGNVVIGEFGGCVSVGVGEVEHGLLGWEARDCHPEGPVHGEGVGLGSGVRYVFVDEGYPGLFGCQVVDTGLGVDQDVGLEEGLEVVFSDQTLEVKQELVALFVGDVREGVVRRLPVEDWVETGVGVGEPIVLHV